MIRRYFAVIAVIAACAAAAGGLALLPAIPAHGTARPPWATPSPVSGFAQLLHSPEPAQPGVWSVAVVGAQDEALGKRPVAYVVPAGPWRRHEMEEALREACEAALPRAKRPGAFCLVQELPLGPTGKVARHRLRDRGDQDLVCAHP